MSSSMNLLPTTYRRRLLVGRRVRQWCVVWGAAAAVSGVAAGIEGKSWIDIRSEFADLQERNQPLVEMQRLSHDLESRIAALEGRESILNDLTGVEQPLGLIAVVSNSASQADSKLQVTSLTIQHLAPTETRGASQPSGKQDQKPPARTASVEITILGVALDDVAVARFVQALSGTGLFLSVELKSTLSVNHARGPARQYDILCRR
jgi:hypothetical protein